MGCGRNVSAFRIGFGAETEGNSDYGRHYSEGLDDRAPLSILGFG